MRGCGLVGRGRDGRGVRLGEAHQVVTGLEAVCPPVAVVPPPEVSEVFLCRVLINLGSHVDEGREAPAEVVRVVDLDGGFEAVTCRKLCEEGYPGVDDVHG